MDVSIRTRRLSLRPPHMDDAPRIALFLNNFAVSGNLSRVPYPYHLADARAWLRTWTPDRPAGETGFAIELPGEGFIGQIGFHRGQRGDAVLGYWLAQPFWSRGFMSEAARAVVDWYFDVAASENIRSGVFHFNRASLAIQRRLGFTETGTSTLHCLARGEEVRHIDTELTRANWAQRQSA